MRRKCFLDIIGLVFILGSFFSLALYAGCAVQTQQQQQQQLKEIPGHIAVLKKNDLAPYPGVLLSVEDFYILENSNEKQRK